MAPSVAGPRRSGLERSCDPGEWVEASGPVDGVELFRAGLRGHPYSRHRHDVYAVGVTEAGAQAFHYRGTVERSAPGQVFVLHPDEPHDGWADGPDLLGYAQIYVAPARIAAALSSITGRPTPLPFAAPVTDDPELARTIRTAFEATPEPLALDALVLELAEGLLRCSAARVPDPPRRIDLRAVERGREYLENRPAVVRSSELEAVTGLDRYQYARQFRALCGTSPYRYSVMRRLDLAREKMREGTPLAETAHAVGFADQAHFTRVFKAAYGMTPGSYARLHRTPGPAQES
ncbi:AraC family transcriptional regulator [Actinomadura madurae]|uniref:AraC family transcriptional regulator n=1 Tax=Actinomadura madurae TaxID=1993 RepID=UPI0020D23EB4|nr:AraC family transcriptional regulator [Actinomadura madurae]MCP9951240.1 AraC family transcriptional regulator [Actinomadura madurae]MCP9968009.1 AraC family transcriptional regulator [Actinomadura madurae]MCP9980467.1 AraC family transcriptional regulator [Actinomadura madurae]MCQ0008016.1 AraC family transcriptional regulator [Actinomadura madurae]MCQ0016668.1 AraC family transcriptional regulator [Actinomadura madurae]